MSQWQIIAKAPTDDVVLCRWHVYQYVPFQWVTHRMLVPDPPVDGEALKP